MAERKLRELERLRHWRPVMRRPPPERICSESVRAHPRCAWSTRAWLAPNEPVAIAHGVSAQSPLPRRSSPAVLHRPAPPYFTAQPRRHHQHDDPGPPAQSVLFDEPA
jgi:hypothetical protein